jgi:hypothetical protein
MNHTRVPVYGIEFRASTVRVERPYARKMDEAFFGPAFNPDRSPPFIAVPGLHGSLAQKFIHASDNRHLLFSATLRSQD